MFPSQTENISTEPIMDILNQIANHEGVSSSDTEDWLNVKNELPTLPQLSDELLLESIVGQSSFEDETSDEEEDEGQDEKVVSNSEAAECFKKYLSWMERQNNVDAIQFIQLRIYSGSLHAYTKFNFDTKTNFIILDQCKVCH